MMRALAEAAVNNWPLAVRSIALAAHRENAVFRVDADEGLFALRVHREGYRTDMELQSELQFMAMLAEHGMAVPAPLASRNGRVVEEISGTQVSVLTWLGGSPLGQTGVPLEINDRLGTFAHLGRLIATLHNTTDRWMRPSGFTRQAWDLEGLLGEAPQWGRFWDNPRLDQRQQKIMCDVQCALRNELMSRPYDMGLIHADLVSENILVEAGELRIIDFDDSGHGFRLQDVATALVKHEAEPDFASLKQALFQGYQSERSLDVAGVDLFLLLRHLTYVGWVVPRMSDAGGLERCDRFIANAVRKSEAWASR